MYTADVLAKMSGVSIDTLNEYMEIGLLKPAETYESSSKNCYTSADLIDLHNITALRQVGFSVNEVIDILKSEHPEQVMQNIKDQIAQKLSDLTIKLALLDEQNIMGMKHNECIVTVRELPEINVASMHVTISSIDEISSFVSLMDGEIKRLGCTCVQPEYCFVIYHGEEYREDSFDIEICKTVLDPKTDTNNIKFRTISTVPVAACAFHRGSYNELRLTHANIAIWMEDHGYEIANDFREVYIDGAWNNRSQSDWLTEIQVPLKRQNG